MNEEKLNKILSNQEKIKAQNRKIINVLTGNKTLDKQTKYQEIKKMAKKSKHGLTRKQASSILDVHRNNVGTHFQKIVEKNDHFHLSNDTNRKGSPEILVYNKSIKSKSSSDASKSKKKSQNPMLW